MRAALAPVPHPFASSHRVARVPDLVPNFVPDSANMTVASAPERRLAWLYLGENERQGANHNPRVGGSSPSSGIVKSLHTRALVVVGCSTGCPPWARSAGARPPTL